MSKDELIDFIKRFPASDFILEIKLCKPAESFDLPDMRTGAIYPPYGHSPYVKATIKEEFEIKITGKKNET